jgi:hypothetical protein
VGFVLKKIRSSIEPDLKCGSRSHLANRRVCPDLKKKPVIVFIFTGPSEAAYQQRTQITVSVVLMASIRFVLASIPAAAA